MDKDSWKAFLEWLRTASMRQLLEKARVVRKFTQFENPEGRREARKALRAIEEEIQAREEVDALRKRREENRRKK